MDNKANEGSSIWKALNNNENKMFSKTFTNNKKNKIFSALSTPRTLDLKTKKTEHYWNQLEQFIKVQSHDQSQVKYKHKRQTDTMAANHFERRKQLQNQLKENVLKQIMKETLEKQQSVIKLQNNDSQTHNPFQKQQKVAEFVKRQQFKARQTLILKQMKEFLEFGAIRK